jgi:hypothetical protein
LALAVASLTQPWYFLRDTGDGASSTVEFLWRQFKYTSYESGYGSETNYNTYSSSERLLATTMGIILAFLTLGTAICLGVVIIQSYLMYKRKTSKIFILLALADCVMFTIAFFTLFNINNALRYVPVTDILTIMFRHSEFCDPSVDSIGWCAKFSGSDTLNGYSIKWGPSSGAWLCLTALVTSLFTLVASIIRNRSG